MPEETCCSVRQTPDFLEKIFAVRLMRKWLHEAGENPEELHGYRPGDRKGSQIAGDLEINHWSRVLKHVSRSG